MLLFATSLIGAAVLSAFQSKLRVVYLGPFADDDDEDVWTAEEGLDRLFSQARIRAASYEDPFVVVFDGGGEVVGAAVVGITGSGWNESSGEMRFSIVVAPGAQRQGVARELVRLIKDHFVSEGQDLLEAHHEWEGMELVAWVVNPHMAELLEQEGFSSDGGDWSEAEPHMRWGG